MEFAASIVTKKRIQPWIFLAAFVALSGCGKSNSSKDQPIQLPVRVFEAPAIYAVTDVECQKQTEEVALTSGLVPAWQEDQVQMIDVSLAGAYTSLSLRNSIVKDTVFGVEYERRCDYAKEEGKECFDRFDQEIDYTTVDGKGWYLRICQNGYEYPRKSAETVALASAHYLDLAHKTYLQLKEPNATVPPQLLLNVLPVFTDIYDNYFENGEQKILKSYWVNNLGYYGGKNMIVVSPPSKKNDEGAPGFYWESQFVLGHEYGHHVERQRTGALKEKLGLDWNPITHSWEDKNLLKFNETNTSELEQVLGAISEGFADLLAFYAEGGTSYSLTGIPGLGKDRDIRLPTFRNSTEKTLTQARLNLLTRRTTVPSSDLDDHFENIHSGGAVIAYAANQIFKAVSLARVDVVEGSKEDMHYRYKLLLQWIDATGEGLALVKSDPAEAHLGQISGAFAKVVDDSVDGFTLRSDTTKKQLQSEVCSVLSEVLPALEKPAFSLSGGGC